MKGVLRASRAQLDPHPMLEILPASFVGCWRGIVVAPDSIRSLNECEAGSFVPELYTLCYRKSSSGKFELTFGGVAMDTAGPAEYKVSAPAGAGPGTIERWHRAMPNGD